MEEAAANGPERVPRTVVGYHGCTAEVARRVLAGEPMRVSSNAYDWLGAGVYFWEHAPARASEWAVQRFGADAAVLAADLGLGHCLDLLDPGHFEGLRRAYEAFVERARAEGLPLPANRDKLHRLDRAVVEYYCHEYAALGGFPFDTVRGCFPEGPPVFEGSRILRETHVQVAVRNPGAIRAVRLLPPER